MKQKLYIVFSILVLSLLVVLPAAAGISGPGVSGVQIQNLDSNASANVVVQLWNQNAASPVTISATSGDTIAKSAAKNYYLPNFSTVQDGSYAMVVSSDKPVAAIARTDWNSTGGAAIYSSIEPGTDITIPLVTQNFSGQTSQFSVQNTDTVNNISDVTITLNGRGLSSPVVVKTGQTIPKGTSKTWNLADTATWGTLPNTGLDMGAYGFVGSVRIQSSTPLVVQSFIDLAGSRGVTGFTGIPTSSAAATVYCPLIRANYYGDTGISIVNPNGTDASVDITFVADNGSPVSGGPWYQNIVVSANSSAVAFQGVGGNSRTAGLPSGSGQTGSNPTPTNNGFYGVAKLQSSLPVLAVVNDTKFGTSWSVQSQSTYNCFTSSKSGITFALPLVRRYHVSSTKLTTGIQIQNTTASSVNVTLELYNWDGTRQSASDPAMITIPANGSGNYWNGNLTGLPTVPPSAGGYGWYGSAILRATGNVVVVVSDEGYGATKVDSANYEGLLMP
jgi:hypothetical protein